jgi:hypothetical protein
VSGIRDELLDELARVFARAAVNRYLRDMDAKKETPAAACNPAGVDVSRTGDQLNDKYTPGAATATNSPLRR